MIRNPDGIRECKLSQYSQFACQLVMEQEHDDLFDIDDSVTSARLQQPSSVELLSGSAQLHLFRLVRLLVTNCNPSPLYLGFILILQTMQILSYPFGKDDSGGSISHSAATALMITNLRFLDPSNQQLLLAVVLLALLLYTLLTVAFALRLPDSISLSDHQNQQVRYLSFRFYP